MCTVGGPIDSLSGMKGLVNSGLFSLREGPKMEDTDRPLKTKYGSVDRDYILIPHPIFRSPRLVLRQDSRTHVLVLTPCGFEGDEF